MEKKKDQTPDVSYGEIRSIGTKGEDEGIVEAYLTKWDTVDSWNTSFKQGAFTNTFNKRGVKGTRLIWNHNELAGKMLEMREDDYGPFVRAQFNLETDAGKKAYAHVRAGDVNCFSFGFNTVKDKWVGQVRQISEVDMLECGPVIFEANDKAKVTDVRAKDFDETQAQRELNNKGWQLINSLEMTIDDIYWQSTQPSSGTIISEVDTAIAKFHTAYMNWLNEYYAQYESREGKAPCEHRNQLQKAINSLDTDDLIKSTTLTSEEVKTMGKGCLLPVEERSKLLVASPILAKAHQETRGVMITTLCDELRHSGLTAGEVERVESLVDLSKKPSEIDGAIGMLRELRSNF